MPIHSLLCAALFSTLHDASGFFDVEMHVDKVDFVDAFGYNQVTMKICIGILELASSVVGYLTSDLWSDFADEFKGILCYSGL